MYQKALLNLFKQGFLIHSRSEATEEKRSFFEALRYVV